MRNGESDGAPEEIVGWPEHHFTVHRKRFSEFNALAVRALLALNMTARRVENEVGSWFLNAGLTAQKFGLLIILHAEDKPVSLSDLRRYLGTTQANVTGLVAGLERDRYIERKASAVDRRVTLVSLSRSGKRAVASMLPTYFAHKKSAMKALTQNEKKTLVDLLAKVARGFETAS
jgi:DNA-binding MarR family transcriptional regulator